MAASAARRPKPKRWPTNTGRQLPQQRSGKPRTPRLRSSSAARIAGLVCLGYPFHPTAKPEQLRTAHLQTLTTPALIVQGERDPFGSRDEIEGYSLSPRIAFHWAGDGDHDLGPRGGKGFTRRGNLEAAADAIATFAAAL